MGYLKVENLKDVSVGFNMYEPGAIQIRRDLETDTIYICANEKYFKVSKEGLDCDSIYRKNIYQYGSNPTIIYGKLIAFKLIIQEKGVLHFAIVDKMSNIPVLIYKEQYIEDENVIDFVYIPKKIEGQRGYEGSIGYINEDTYNAVSNKARLLDKPQPKTSYVKKANTLLRKIEGSDILPMRYSPEHENISLEDIYPQEMNKLYFVSKLRHIIDNYSDGMIYYSGCLKELERKFKLLCKYFKMDDIA